MGKIKIDDLNEEVTLSEESVKHVRGGAGYIKFDGVDGESRVTYDTHDGNKRIDVFSPTKWKI